MKLANDFDFEATGIDAEEVYSRFENIVGSCLKMVSSLSEFYRIVEEMAFTLKPVKKKEQCFIFASFLRGLIVASEVFKS